jgi:hypothetical protein
MLEQEKKARVRRILVELRGLSARDVAKVTGDSTCWIWDVRSGRRCADVLPELPRGGGKLQGRSKKLSDERKSEIVADVLRDRRGESQSALARRHDVSRQYINQIMQGKALAHVLPELPRGLAGAPCERCVHGVKPDRCGLGFPEAWSSDAWGCPAYVCSGSRPCADA